MTKLDLSLTWAELDGYLAVGRTARVASVGLDGLPHVIPLWFVWFDGSLFMNSTLGNVTVDNFRTCPVAAAVIDDGESYDDLRGVVLRGPVSRADQDTRIPEVEHRWSEKYLAGNPVPFARWSNRVWLRLDPTSVGSWDFRKITEARARKRAAKSQA